MTITAATALIGRALSAGLIDRETAIRAQSAIRAGYYGSRMSNADRAQMLALLFGLVEG
jgi:hypothetical protein